MKVEIFIITYGKDSPWLEWCLKSITKFCQGFSGVTVAVPVQDAPIFETMCSQHNAKLRLLQEPPPPLGHLFQNAQKCRADEHCPEADYILHLDSDCIFRWDAKPEDYFRDGKPVLLIESYASLEKQFPGFPWRAVVQKALQKPVQYETMRRPCMVNPRGIYLATRQAVEAAQHMPFDQYVLGTKSTFPYGFCEFNTIGAVALTPPWNTQYYFHDVTKLGWPRNNVQQFWSHGGLQGNYDIWVDGVQKKVVPIDYIKQVLGT